MKSNLFILLTFFLGHLLAQETEVHLSLNSATYDIGEPMTVTVKTNTHGEIDIDFPSAFIHGYDVMNGMEQDMDASTGKVTTYYYLSQTGTINKPGKYTIGPAYIKIGNKSFESNTVNIEIGEKVKMTGGLITKQQLKDPAFGVILTNKNEIYEGEPLIISAKVYSTFEPTNFDGYHSYELDALTDKHDISKSSRILIDKEHFKNNDYFSFEYDKNVIFPTGVGTTVLMPFKMTILQGFSGYSLSSGAKKIKVKALPDNEPTDFISAVGDFNFTRVIKDSTIKQGNVFKMSLIVEGSGNIHNISNPRLTLPQGFVIYGDPIINEQYSFGTKGASGYIEFTYNIQVNNAGEHSIPPMSVSYFNPQKGKYITVQSDTNYITVLANPKYNHTAKTNQKNDDSIHIYPEPMKEKREASTETSFNTALYWSSISTPLLFSLLFIAFRRSSNKNKCPEQIEIKETIIRTNKRENELKKASQCSNYSAYYKLSEEIIIEYIIQTSGISSMNSRDVIVNSIEDKELSKRISDLLKTMDLCKYGLGDTNIDFEQVKSETENIIEILKSKK